MPNKSTTLREEIRTRLTYATGEYIFDDLDRVCDSIIDFLTSHNTELLQKIEGMRKDVEPLENLEGIKLNDVGIKRFVTVSCDHRQNAVLDKVINLIKQEK